MAGFNGTWRLIRLALRRDRIVIPITIALVIAMVAGSAPSLLAAYPDTTAQLAYVSSSAPSIIGRIFQGTVHGANIGTIVMAELYITTAAIMAIASIFLVSRHTRYNEETGAGELIGSGVVSQQAPLSAALIVAIGMNVITAVLIFLSLLPVKELSTVGTAFLAASLGLVGIFFATVSAITVQLSDYRRGSNGLAIATLIGFFVIRALGDVLGKISPDGLIVTPNWITWLSPFGWGYQVLPYNVNRIIPLVLLAIGSLIACIVGFYLQSKRDIGSSIFASKQGLARAKPSLLSANGLAFRLQSTGFLGWSVGFILFGAVMAVTANDFRKIFESSDVLQEFLAATSTGGDFLDTIISSMFPIIAAMLAGYVVTSLSKMQDEESSGRIEPLMGTALSRTRWFFSHVSLTTAGVILNLVLMGLAGGIGFSLASGQFNHRFSDVLISASVSIPTMLLFMAVILVVYSLFGRFTKTFSWFFYGYCTLISSFAGIFKWPQWTLNFSPFSHTPGYPSTEFSVQPMIIMTALALVLILLANGIFNRRDLNLK